LFGLANSSSPLDISFENKKHTPTTQRGDHSNNTQHNSEGRPVKAIRCARERTGAGRLVFGEDVKWTRFWIYQKEQWWVGSEGKNWAWIISKVGYITNGYQRSPRCPISDYLPEGGSLLFYLPRLM
jgi:hypothetical protein